MSLGWGKQDGRWYAPEMGFYLDRAWGCEWDRSNGFRRGIQPGCDKSGRDCLPGF